MTNNNLQWTFAGYVLRVTWLACRNCGGRHQRQGFYKLLLGPGPNDSVMRRYIPHSDRISPHSDITRIIDNDHIPICNSCFETATTVKGPTLDEANWRMTVERKHRAIKAEAAARKEADSGKINLLDFAARVRNSLDPSHGKKEVSK